MRFSTVAVAAFAAFVSAASEAATATSSLTAAQSSEAACLKACSSGDVDCQAHCIAVPSPDKSQVEDTTDCVKKCPQGKGTKEDNETYGQCINSCIKAHYFVTSSGTPEATGSAESSPDADVGSGLQTTGSLSGSSGLSAPTSTGISSSSSSATGTQTGDSANATNSDSSAAAIGGSAASLFGLLAVVFAL